MKKLVFFVLVLLTITLLFSCDTTANTESIVSTCEEKTIDYIFDSSALLSDQPVGDGKFFEDDKYIYSFDFPRSDWITVVYTDGTKENIKTALENGNAKIEDLDRFNIEYLSKSKDIDESLDTSKENVTEIKKIVSIIDNVGSNDTVHTRTMECFYSTDMYDYIFSFSKSHRVIVYYEDGKNQNIADALKAGNIMIGDLDRFGIEYFTKPKQIKKIVDNSAVYLKREYLPIEEVFYQDENYTYTFPITKSHDVIVTYADDSTQNVKDALATGAITINDLKWYGVCYSKVKADGTYEEKELLNVIKWNERGYNEKMPGNTLFYTDDEYEYYLRDAHKIYIIAYYSDGTAQRIDTAIVEGNVSVSVLDEYNIDYYTYPVPPAFKTIKSIDGGAPNQPREAKEIFFKDDEYCYVFPKVQSRNIYVRYEYHSDQKLPDALREGSVTLADIESFGFKFTKEPLGKYSDKKTVSDIVNLAFLYELPLPSAEEVFYQDDENKYIFGAIMSGWIIVYYTDGTGEYLVDALESGHINITDLDKFGIGYGKESKSR